METGLITYKPNTAIEIRRQMAQCPSVMSALDSVERAVFLASTVKSIGDCSYGELSSELAKALKYIAKDVGYRETGEQERAYLVARLCEILKRHYSGLSMKDFRMAFEMSITGELDEYLPKGRDGQADRGHYQQFNAEYVCKILNAYKARRAAILRKANEAIPEAEPARDMEKEAALFNSMRRDCIEAFRRFKEDGRLPDMSPIAEMLYYQILSDAGLAPAVEITIDEQKAIYQRTMNRYARGGMMGDMRRLEKEGHEAPELQRGAFTLARRKALKKTFERMVAEGIELTDYIKFE